MFVFLIFIVTFVTENLKREAKSILYVMIKLHYL